MEEKDKTRSSVTKINYLFQGQTAISQHWFKPDTDWIQGNFMTIYPDLFKSIYQKKYSRTIR